jgi:hypothetical protein
METIEATLALATKQARQLGYSRFVYWQAGAGWVIGNNGPPDDSEPMFYECNRRSQVLIVEPDPADPEAYKRTVVEEPTREPRSHREKPSPPRSDVFELSREPVPVKPKPFRPEVQPAKQKALFDGLDWRPDQKPLFAD